MVLSGVGTGSADPGTPEPDAPHTPSLGEVFNGFALGAINGATPASPAENFRTLLATDPFYVAPALQGTEKPGTILINTDARYLYYVLPGGKAVRYGVAVGNEALAWSGVATVGRMAEWPDWIPTPDIQARLGPFPDRVPGGPANPLGARALYLFQGKTDTLYRIHGTNQPQYIGQAVSSGCIRMTNEDVIDLFDRAKLGATVIVLAPGQSGSSAPAAGRPG